MTQADQKQRQVPPPIPREQAPQAPQWTRVYLAIGIASAVLILGGVLLRTDPIAMFISIGIVASITLLVMAMFGQSGQVKLSPQRAAAIAAGHEDRQTVFENRWSQPVMWLLLSAAHRLAMPRLKAWLRRQLVAAGSPNYYTPEEYLALAMSVGLALAGFAVVIGLLLTGRFNLMLMVVVTLGGTGLVVYQLHDKAQTRLRLIGRRLPYALDLISLAMGAGANFAEAMQTMVRERTEDPLNDELRIVLAEMELGTTRRRALQNLTARVPLESMRSIVASVIQSEELGTPLGNVLHDQASLLRLQRSVRAENRAAVASVRILIPCLLLVMAVILAVFGPAIIRAMREGLF